MDFVPRWPGVWDIRMLWQQTCYEHIIHNLNSYHTVDKSPYESLLESGCICMIFRFLFILLSLSLCLLSSPLFLLLLHSSPSHPSLLFLSLILFSSPTLSLSLPHFLPSLCPSRPCVSWLLSGLGLFCYDEVTRSKASLGRSICPVSTS